MKKLLALILALVMCFSLVACGGGQGSKPSEPSDPGSNEPTTPGFTEPDKTVKYKDTVKISIAGERQVTGYYGSTNTQAAYFGRMTMEPLFRYNFETNAVEPVIAKEAIDVNGDGKTWKVTIRDDVVFHNQGEYYADLKASDVKFTYDFIKTDGAGRVAGAVTRTSDITNYVESIDVNGDYELTFHLTSAIFDFPAWNHGLFILSEKAIEEFGPADGQDVFTGPYWINKAESTLGQQWTMTRYDDYYGGIDNYPTKNIVFVIHTDANTGAAALQAGEVDALVCATPTIAIQFKNNPDFTVHDNAGLTTWFVGFNSYDGTGFFDGEDTEEQIKIRQAINYALDRDKIVSVMFAVDPEAGVRVDSVFGESNPGYVDAGKWEFSVEKGRALMNELGYNENNRLALVLAHIPRYTTYAQVIQDLLKEIYIDCELKNIEGTQYGSFLRTGKDWDLFCNYYATSTTMMGTVTTHMQSAGGGSRTQGWNSAETDKRIDNIMAQPTKEAQEEAFAEFQKWVHDYHPRIPTHADKNMIEAIAELEGISVCPDVNHQDFATFRIPE